MIHRILISLFFLVQLSSCILAQHHPPNGTRWALLVAGSRGYGNYRHQADVCHAFQILKKGGLQEENIIVFMYDDIAFDPNNPRPGVIVNSPNGDDVYQGVPKDYTGEHANVQNLFAVILGDRSNLTGGSGKVLDTGPTDHIFIFYTDHGTAGAILMASDEYVYADELNNVLKRKHEANAYASMVFYLEACESGSMFEGLLPETLNIYAVTASNASESSYATYCPDDPHISPAYQTCLGDLYSVSWMEDSEKHDLRRETLGQQFQVVKHRTAVNIYGSHVMQYGRLVLSSEFLSTYQGTPNHNYTSSAPPSTVKAVVGQWEADLLHYQHKIYRAPSGSTRRQEAQKQLSNEIRRRMLIDNKMKEISTFLFGAQNGEEMLHAVRPGGKALVDDWSCLKTFVRIYEDHCGTLTRYGMKYTRAIANACNAGITKMQMDVAAARVCSK